MYDSHYGLCIESKLFTVLVKNTSFNLLPDLTYCTLFHWKHFRLFFGFRNSRYAVSVCSTVGFPLCTIQLCSMTYCFVLNSLPVLRDMSFFWYMPFIFLWAGSSNDMSAIFFLNSQPVDDMSTILSWTVPVLNDTWPIFSVPELSSMNDMSAILVLYSSSDAV